MELEPIKKISLRDKIILWLMVVVLVFIAYVSLDANKYRAMVRVIVGEGKVGVNPTSESLDFGDLSRGTSAVRRVKLNNGTAIPMYVMIFKTGGIRTLMKTDKNYFRLLPHTETEIDFTTYMPASAEIGKEYDGRVFLFKIPIL